ncbi:prepilin-type N-terminal cleavage/methylation domain [Escherichia coli]|nr:prepilin-type N-terminal cleavage/methylation domain [Escherichia coli]
MKRGFTLLEVMLALAIFCAGCHGGITDCQRCAE